MSSVYFSFQWINKYIFFNLTYAIPLLDQGLPKFSPLFIYRLNFGFATKQYSTSKLSLISTNLIAYPI